MQQLRASCSSGEFVRGLRSPAFQVRILHIGIPESLRPQSWRLLLDYLPPQRSRWPEFLQKQRETYADLVLDMIVRPGDSNSELADHVSFGIYTLFGC